MKKWWAQISKYASLALLTAVLVWYFWPYLHPGLPVTHDGENHVARFAQYYLAAREGQLIPRVAPMLENGYGYPVFNYNYPLANILSLPPTALKVDFETEYKFLILMFVSVGIVSVYYWLEYLFGRKRSRVLPVMAFLLAPPLWAGIWYRGNIGEVAIYCLIPLVCWQIERLRAGKKWASCYLAVSLAAYFLSHNVMVLFASPLVIAYAWWRLFPVKCGQCLYFKQLSGKRKIWWGLVIALLGLGCSLWFWLPAFFEKNLVALDGSALNQEYMWHFARAAQLWQTSSNNGLSWPGQVDGLSFGAGVVVTFAWWLTAYCGWRQKTDRFCYPRLGGVLILLLGFLWWAQTDYSFWLWQRIPFVNFIQFPWRLGWLVSLGGVLMLANFVPTRRSNWWWTSVLTVQFLVLGWARPQDYFHHEREYYLQYPMSTTTSREDLPLTFRFDISEEASREPTIAKGRGRLLEVERLTTTRKKYALECEDTCVVVEHTAYFPGFETVVDGRAVRYVDDEQIRGRIAFIVDVGRHEVITRWREKTGIRISGDVLSVLSGVGIILLACGEGKKKK